MKVLFTDPAESELEAIGDWIAKNNPLRAPTFVGELRQACLQIGFRPNAYPLVEHRKSDGLRRRVYGNYLIFYRVTEDAVEIIQDYAGIIFPNDPD